MSSRNSFVRSLHDLGLAGWFGGSLMGAIGLNGGASTAADPRERLKVSSNGWAIWTPWQVGAIATHAVGGLGLLLANRGRLRRQSGAKTNTAVKLALTAAAAAATGYSGYLGLQVKQRESQGTVGVTEPAGTSSGELSSAQQQLRFLQWTIPALTGAMVVLGAQQGEQQRGFDGLVDKLPGR